MTTPLFLLRCLQVGLKISDLSQMTVGLVYDLFVEAGNDSWDYAETATQEDFDRF